MSPKFNSKPGFSPNMINNKWQDAMSSKDKLIFNVILNSRLKHYGYTYASVSSMDRIFVFFLILAPLSFEYKAVFTQITIWQFIYKFKKNIVGYIARIMLFYKYYFKELTGKKFTEPFINMGKD